MQDKVKKPQSGPAAPERLVGWLVSYALDDLGRTYEIRSGRSFVTGRKCVEGRQVDVDEESISSPHLVLKASHKHRVMVQDIFSDHGTFLTRGDSDKEQPLTGPTELKHGDWIRIGKNTRFQVCLIDGQGR